MARKRSLGKGSRVAFKASRAGVAAAKPKDDADLRSAPSSEEDSSRLGRLKQIQRQQAAAVDRTSRAVGASTRTPRGRSRSR